MSNVVLLICSASYVLYSAGSVMSYSAGSVMSYSIVYGVGICVEWCK